MVNHIDDSRERPESAVSDDSRNKGKTPGEAMAEKAVGHSVHKTTKNDLEEDGAERKHKQRQDTIADDSRERPESAVSDDRASQDFSGR